MTEIKKYETEIEGKKIIVEYLKSVGGKWIRIPYYKGRTTTGIINEIIRRTKEGKKKLR